MAEGLKNKTRGLYKPYLEKIENLQILFFFIWYIILFVFLINGIVRRMGDSGPISINLKIDNQIDFTPVIDIDDNRCLSNDSIYINYHPENKQVDATLINNNECGWFFVAFISTSSNKPFQTKKYFIRRDYSFPWKPRLISIEDCNNSENESGCPEKCQE